MSAEVTLALRATSLISLSAMMRIAVAQCTVAGIGALGVTVGRGSAPCRSISQACRWQRSSNLISPGRSLSLQPASRYASTVSTSTTRRTEAESTPAQGSSNSAGENDEEAELQRLQALIKEKLAKQKQRLLDELSPLPGEQTSGFKRRTRAQREAERSVSASSTPPAAEDYIGPQQQQRTASTQNGQPWEQLASPLPLRKPTRLHSPTNSTSSTTRQSRRTATPSIPPRRALPRTPPTNRPISDSEQQQRSTADTDEDRYRRGRHNDPNFNPDRQSMLHDRNVRKEEQKRIKVQRRLEREETERVARQDDELFHDVSSPRQKVRGKGIAGRSVLAKHQRHPKGVREERARHEDDRQLATSGSVEERMSRSVFAEDARAVSGAGRVDAERDRHRRLLKYAERGERGSRHEWAGAGKPGRWEEREQRWQSGRTKGRVRRVGQEYVSAERPRGHGVAFHPHGHSVNKRDVPTAASSRTYSREEPRRPTKRNEQSQSKGQFSWLSDMKQHASSMQQEREERQAKRDRGKGRR